MTPKWKSVCLCVYIVTVGRGKEFMNPGKSVHRYIAYYCNFYVGLRHLIFKKKSDHVIHLLKNLYWYAILFELGHSSGDLQSPT